MELQELYSPEVMDQLIGIAVEEDRMDIRGFKSLLREYNSGEPCRSRQTQKQFTEPGTSLTRDCSYYEDVYKGGRPCRQ